MGKRLFIAIDLPATIRQKLVHIQHELEKLDLFTGKFTRIEQLHLTLKFIGDVEEQKVSQIEQILTQVKYHKITASLGKLGVFPSKKFISVIWIELNGKIHDLIKELNAALESIVVREQREFVSHITLARVKSLIHRDELLVAIEKMPTESQEFEITEFVLKESELTEHGARHQVIARFPLK